jgi:hypothetical protein
MVIKHNLWRCLWFITLLVTIDDKDIGGAELVGLTLTLQIYSLKYSVRNSAETSAILTGILWFFSLSSGK